MHTFELAIIGGGPAGVAAGVYASRKKLNTIFITKDWGGQSTVSTDIQNWIGSPSISGQKLASDLKNHLMTYASDVVTIQSGVTATQLAKNPDGSFTVTTSDTTTYQVKAVLIAAGSKRRQLDVRGAAQFEHKGLTYCASCDGPMFGGQSVAVIGGGNAAFETAAQLLAYAKDVTLFQRGTTFRADPVTVEKVLAHPNMHAITDVSIEEIVGDKFVSGIRFHTPTAPSTILPVTGIFVEIGMIPNTDFVADTITRDEYGRIVIDPWTQQTSTPGIWAAGDCTNVLYHQNNIAAGDAVRALEDIYINLRAR